jgi:hypothetical protein
VVETLNSKKPYGVQFEQETGSLFYWAACPKLVNDPSDVRKLILDGGIDFSKVVILEGKTQTNPNECETQEFNTNNHVSRFYKILNASNPNRIDVRVSTDHPAWLIHSAVWYPGWQAWLDGKRVAILRANYLFRAVYIPEGNHELSFIYKPLSFWLGCVLTFISSFLFCFIIRKRKVSE